MCQLEVIARWLHTVMLQMVKLGFTKSKKLRLQGLRIVGWLFLTLATLNMGVGALVVLASTSPAGFSITESNHQVNGLKIIHLQMFGGLIHFHDNVFADAQRSRSASSSLPIKTVQVLPMSVSKSVLSTQHYCQDISLNSTNAYKKLSITSVSGFNYDAELLRLFTPDYESDCGVAEPQAPPPTSYPLLFKQTQVIDTFLTIPDRPPISKPQI